MKSKIFFVLLVAVYVYAMIMAYNEPATAGYEVVAEENAEENEESPLPVEVEAADFQLSLLIPGVPQLRGKLALPDTVAKRTPNRYGAVTMTGGGLDPAIFLRTDRIGEFILRFNGDSTAMAALSDRFDFTVKGKYAPRVGHILGLVNEVNILDNEVLKEFASDIHDNRLLIDEKNGSNYLAVTTMGYKDVKGELFPVRFVFRQSAVDGAPVWYMKHVDSPYFTYGVSNAPYYIDYAERELDFMGLSRHTDRSAASVAGPDFRGDNLSVFLFLSNKGLIKYDHAEFTRFVFKLGDYTFLVENVESFEHKRSGYLITKIAKQGQVIFENSPIE